MSLRNLSPTVSKVFTYEKTNGRSRLTTITLQASCHDGRTTKPMPAMRTGLLTGELALGRSEMLDVKMKNSAGLLLARRVATFVIIAMMSSVARSAHIQQLITNGNFETGTLAGWSASTLPFGCCTTWTPDWNVAASASAGGVVAVANPIDTFAAYSSFDGPGPVTRTLTQSFHVPDYQIAQAILSFADSEYIQTFHGGRLPRLFDVFLSDGLLTQNVFHFESKSVHSPTFAQRSIDVTSLLQGWSGETVQLSFVLTIPEYGTGPGGFGLDNVSLTAQVPEPCSLALVGLSFLPLALTRRRMRSSTKHKGEPALVASVPWYHSSLLPAPAASTRSRASHRLLHALLRKCHWPRESFSAIEICRVRLQVD